MSPEEASVRAVQAGADILICARVELRGACPPTYLERLRKGLLDAIHAGRLPISRVRESYMRVMDSKARLTSRSSEAPDISVVGSKGHLDITARVTDAARSK